MDYKQKYLKYKQKYLNLKQKGGVVCANCGNEKGNSQNCIYCDIQNLTTSDKPYYKNSRNSLSKFVLNFMSIPNIILFPCKIKTLAGDLFELTLDTGMTISDIQNLLFRMKEILKLDPEKPINLRLSVTCEHTNLACQEFIELEPVDQQGYPTTLTTYQIKPDAEINVNINTNPVIIPLRVQNHFNPPYKSEIKPYMGPDFKKAWTGIFSATYGLEYNFVNVQRAFGESGTGLELPLVFALMFSVNYLNFMLRRETRVSPDDIYKLFKIISVEKTEDQISKSRDLSQVQKKEMPRIWINRDEFLKIKNLITTFELVPRDTLRAMLMGNPDINQEYIEEFLAKI